MNKISNVWVFSAEGRNMEQVASSSKQRPHGSRSSSSSEALRVARRLVRGMRRAARSRGLSRAAVAHVARQLGGAAHDVHAQWCELRSQAVVKLAMLSRGGAAAAELTALDWAVADLLQLYVPGDFDERIYEDPKRLRMLSLTFEMVQQFCLEGPGGTPRGWQLAARHFTQHYCPVSALTLQRRWFELKADARHRARDHNLALLPIHRDILRKYPHLVEEESPPWNQLVAEGKVAKPTSEYGPRPGAAPGAREPRDEREDSDTDSASSCFDENEFVFKTIERELFANNRSPPETIQPSRKTSGSGVRKKKKSAEGSVRKKMKFVQYNTNIMQGKRKKSRISIPKTVTALENLRNFDVRNFNCDKVDISNHSERRAVNSEDIINENSKQSRLEGMAVKNPRRNKEREYCDYIDISKNNTHVSRIPNYMTVHKNNLRHEDYSNHNVDKHRGDVMDVLYGVQGEEVGIKVLHESDEEDNKNNVAFDLLTIEENPLFSKCTDQDTKSFPKHASDNDAIAKFDIDPKLLMYPNVVLTRIEDQPMETLLKEMSHHRSPLHTKSSPVGPPWVVLTRIEDQPWLFQAFPRVSTSSKSLSSQCSLPHPNECSYLNDSVFTQKSPSIHTPPVCYDPMTPLSLPSPHQPPMSRRPSSPYFPSSPVWPPATPWTSPSSHRTPSPHGPPQSLLFSSQHDVNAPCGTEKHIEPLYNGMGGEVRESGIEVVRRNKRCEVTAHIAPKRHPWLGKPSSVHEDDLNSPDTQKRRLSSASLTASEFGSRTSTSFQFSPPPTPSSIPLSPQMLTSPVHFEDIKAQFQTPISRKLVQEALALQKDLMRETQNMHSGEYLNVPRSHVSGAFNNGLLSNSNTLHEYSYSSRSASMETVRTQPSGVDPMNGSDGSKPNSTPDNFIQLDSQVNQVTQQVNSPDVTRMTPPQTSPGLNPLEKALSDLLKHKSIPAKNGELPLGTLPGEPMVNLTKESDLVKHNSVPNTSAQNKSRPIDTETRTPVLTSLLRAGPMVDLTQEYDSVDHNTVPNTSVQNNTRQIDDTETDSPVLTSLLKAGPMVDLTQYPDLVEHNSVPVSSAQTNTRQIDASQTDAAPSVALLNTGPMVDLTGDLEELEEQNSMPKSNCSEQPRASFDSDNPPSSEKPLKSERSDHSQETDLAEDNSIPNGSLPTNTQIQIDSTLSSGSVVDLTDDIPHPGDDNWRGAPYLEWSAARVPAHRVVRPAAPPPAVLCAPPPPAPCWVLGAGYLLLSERALPAPAAALWTLRPRRLLQVSESDAESERTRRDRDWFHSAAPAAPPPHRVYTDDTVYQKMTDRPLSYAKLLVCVRDAHACRALLVRGAPLQLYCLRSGELYPLQAERLPNGSSRVTGARAAASALDDLRRVMLQVEAPPPTQLDAQMVYLRLKHEQISSHPSSELLCDVREALEMSHEQFVATYRLPRDSVLALMLEVMPLMPAGDQLPLSREKKILCCLEYLSSLRSAEDVASRQRVSRDTLLRGVAHALSTLTRRDVTARYLRPPHRAARDRDRIRDRFVSRWGLPGVVGALLGVHVRVLPPGAGRGHVPPGRGHVPPGRGHVPPGRGHVPPGRGHVPRAGGRATRNQDGTHSLNVQLVCDADGYILSVDATNGGATCDADTWATHELRPTLLALRREGREDAWLIGGPSYRQDDVLMVPLKSPCTRAQVEYNERLRRAYSTIVAECLTALRTRWPRLRLARHAPAAVKVITAGAVLHNIANSADKPTPNGLHQSKDVIDR